MHSSSQRHLDNISKIENNFNKPIKTVLQEFNANRAVKVSAIAKALGISIATLQEWFTRYNIIRRGSGTGIKTASHSAKISKALIGRKLSEEHLAATRKGHIASGHWKGWYIDKYGYKHIGIPGNGYILEHRLVVERSIGRKLIKSEIVHHIDSNTLNNDIDNLAVISRKEHSLINKLLTHIDANLASAIVKTLLKRFPSISLP